MFVYYKWCFEEFVKINVLKYTLWLFSQQLLAVITVEVCVGTLCVERRLLVDEYNDSRTL